MLERWPVLVLSLLSARFANRVNSHTVGLATGILLTVMGGALIAFNIAKEYKLKSILKHAKVIIPDLYPCFVAWGYSASLAAFGASLPE